MNETENLVDSRKAHLEGPSKLECFYTCWVKITKADARIVGLVVDTGGLSF
jgi:hypothetical protein